MYRKASTLDDLLRHAFEALLKSKSIVVASRGKNRELLGVLLRLTDPRARLSHTDKKGKIFSGLGELLWYLAKTDDVEQIAYYIPPYRDDAENGRINGAYGPRIFAMRGKHDQFENVAALLKQRDSSRKAVIQLFNAEDVASGKKEIPCTCDFQFMIRAKRLHMIAHMRSNDAFLGLPHDVFAFTMMQEILARKLGVEVGEYVHFVGSLHLKALGVPESEWDKCPSYVLDELSHINSDGSFHRVLDDVLIPGITYPKEQILQGLETAYDSDHFGAPDVWLVAKKWLQTRGVQ